MNTDKPAQVVLKNVSVKWAKLIRPGQAFDEGQPDLWSVNMYVTDEDNERLQAIGANPREDKDGHNHFVAKRNVKNKQGDAVAPPAFVDGRKMPVTEDIGNGSVCNIAVTPFSWEKGKKGTASYKSGVLLYLNAVQVVTLIPRNNGVDAFEVIDDAMAAKNEFDDLPFN